jgi:hypothetical protein
MYFKTANISPLNSRPSRDEQLIHLQQHTIALVSDKEKQIYNLVRTTHV